MVDVVGDLQKNRQTILRPCSFTSGFLPEMAEILLDRVDSLQKGQGPLNKMFKNGNVRIMIAGSSKPDLSIIDSPDYLALYQLIRERSR